MSNLVTPQPELARILEQYQTEADMLARIAELEALLAKIAFDDGVSSASSSAASNPAHMAYTALGGRIENGRRIDTRDTLLKPI